MGGRVGLFALALGFLLSTGCGGSSSNDTAQLRVFHGAVNAAALNVLIDGSIVAGNLNYGAATDYLTVKAGSIHVQAVPVGGGSPVLDQSVSIAANAHQTLVMTGTNSSALIDGGTTAVTGDGHVRVFNASNNMGSSDVYIVNPGTGLSGATPVTKNLAFGSDTGYQTFPAPGNYEVFMTVPGTTTVDLATGPLNLAATSTNQTVVVFDSALGGFTYILLTDQ